MTLYLCTSVICSSLGAMRRALVPGQALAGIIDWHGWSRGTEDIRYLSCKSSTLCSGNPALEVFSSQPFDKTAAVGTMDGIGDNI